MTPHEPAAAVGTEEWRAAMVAHLAERMEAVSRGHRRHHRPTKRQRPGSGNSRAVGDRAPSLRKKGFDDASL